MDSMGLTRYMSALMDDALKQARFFDHEFIMPEHLLLALLRQFSFCQALQEEDVDCMKMHEDLVNWLAKQGAGPFINKIFARTFISFQDDVWYSLCPGGDCR